ncbi:MAG: hypothetical protein ACFFDX_08860 [Candidatus Odinarchaeota archaeon]
MENIKENLWIFALVGGVIGIIAFFTPAWTFAGSYVWLWNLYTGTYGTGFIETEEVIFYLGLVSTIILLVGFISLLVTAILSRLKKKNFNIIWIIGGILSAISPIIYLAGSAVEYSSIWQYYTVSSSLILPFIAAWFGISAGILGIIKKRE